MIYMTVNWNEIQGKPETFTPSSHVHNLATEDTSGFLSSSDYKKIVNLLEMSKTDVIKLVDRVWHSE